MKKKKYKNHRLDEYFFSLYFGWLFFYLNEAKIRRIRWKTKIITFFFFQIFWLKLNICVKIIYYAHSSYIFDAVCCLLLHECLRFIGFSFTLQNKQRILRILHNNILYSYIAVVLCSLFNISYRPIRDFSLCATLMDEKQQQCSVFSIFIERILPKLENSVYKFLYKNLYENTIFIWKPNNVCDRKENYMKFNWNFELMKTHVFV